MKCPNCGLDKSLYTTICDCGFDFESEELESLNKKEKIIINSTPIISHRAKPLYVKKKSNIKLYIICGVIAFIIALAFTVEEENTPDKLTAYVMSHVFVERNLKAPSTAKFPWFRDIVVKDLGGGRFSVSAYVDAQNSFGAQIRTNYTCVLKGVDEINWTLESINM